MARSRMTRRGPGGLAVAGAVCLAYGAVVATTRPFTAGADAAVAVALGAAAVVGGHRMVSAGPMRSRPGTGARAGGGRGGGRRMLLVWGPVLVAVLALELFSVTHAPRAAYPTLSSLLDSLDGTRAGKTLGAAAWLALGWWLVDR